MSFIWGTQTSDQWLPVRLVDAADLHTPETSIAYGSVTCFYKAAGGEGETEYTVGDAQWTEQGSGNYWLHIGASEFASNCLYVVTVKATGCKDFNFVVDSEALSWSSFLTGWSVTRASYLDALNTGGQLANTTNAATFKAAGFSTHTAANVKAAIEAGGSTLATIAGHVGTILTQTDSVEGSQATILANIATAKTVIDAIDTLTKAAGDGDLAALVTAVAALNNLSQAQVLAAEITELAATPGASPTLEEAIAFLYMKLRNKLTETATAQTIANDAGDTIATAEMSDDGTTFTKGEFA